jgi:hypothetical protein
MVLVTITATIQIPTQKMKKLKGGKLISNQHSDHKKKMKQILNF